MWNYLDPIFGQTNRRNHKLWCVSCRNVPYRVRVRLARKRNEDEDSPHKLYTLVTYIPVTTFKGMLTCIGYSPMLLNHVSSRCVPVIWVLIVLFCIQFTLTSLLWSPMFSPQRFPILTSAGHLVIACPLCVTPTVWLLLHYLICRFPKRLLLSQIFVEVTWSAVIHVKLLAPLHGMIFTIKQHIITYRGTLHSLCPMKTMNILLIGLIYIRYFQCISWQKLINIEDATN